MDDGDIRGCSFESALLKGKGLALGYGARRAKFVECDFSDARFIRLEYRASTFEECVFDRARFTSCVLSNPAVRPCGATAPRLVR